MQVPQTLSHLLHIEPLKYCPLGQLSKQEASDNFKLLLHVTQAVLVASVQVAQVESQLEHKLDVLLPYYPVGH